MESGRGPGVPDGAAEGPSTTGGLASGYSSRSSNGGTGGDVLKQRGSGFSPGADSRNGAAAQDTDPLAREGVAGGAAGMEPTAHALDTAPDSDSATRGAAVTSGQDATGDDAGDATRSPPSAPRGSSGPSRR